MVISQSLDPKSVEMLGIRELGKDLFEPKPVIFWTDLLLSVVIGWGAFLLAYLAQPMSWLMGIAILGAAIALYRALTFIHELTHLKQGAIPGFAFAWNCLVGIPLLLPSFTYLNVHSDHHRLATYGTVADPEYLPFAGKKMEILVFIAHSLLLPGLILLRFLILSPLGLIWPAFHNFLERHGSSLSLNLSYVRVVSTKERQQMKLMELAILLVWVIPLTLTAKGVISWHWLGIWYVVGGCILLVNTLRTLGAHRYRSAGTTLNLAEQLADSVDTPGKLWTVLWAPVGLRYHALHHYFPSMPYHHLATAHRRLCQVLPGDHVYYQTLSPSLWSSLTTLWNSESLEQKSDVS